LVSFTTHATTIINAASHAIATRRHWLRRQPGLVIAATYVTLKNSVEYAISYHIGHYCYCRLLVTLNTIGHVIGWLILVVGCHIAAAAAITYS